MQPEHGRAATRSLGLRMLAGAAVVGTLVGSQFTSRVRPLRLKQGFGALIIVVGMIVMVRRAVPQVRELLRSGSIIPVSQRLDRG